MRKRSIALTGVLATAVVSAFPSGVVQAADGDQWRGVSPGFTWPRRGIDDVEAVGAREVWVSGYHSNSKPLLLRWKDGAWKSHALPGFTENPVKELSSRGPNDVWAAGSSSGGPYLAHWDGAAWTRVAVPEAHAYGSPLLATDDSGLWFASGKTVSRREGASWGASKTFDGNIIELRSFAPDRAWVRAYNSQNGKELWHWNGVSWSKPGLPNDPYSPWVISGPDSVWSWTMTGLASWDGSSLTEIPYPEDYQGVYIDKAGVKTMEAGGHWVSLALGGGKSSGWLRWTNGAWQSYRSSLGGNTPDSVLVDPKGQIWGVSLEPIRYPLLGIGCCTVFTGRLVKWEEQEKTWTIVSKLLPRARYQLTVLPGTGNVFGAGRDEWDGSLRAVTNSP